MEQPFQRPPVERNYMRLVVGRKGKPESAESDAAPRRPSKRTKQRRQQPRGGDYLVELTTFHVRQPWRRGWQ
jgi:hypothetical protein